MKIFTEKGKLSSTFINIIKGVSILGLFTSLVYVNMTRPRVLVLHSYAEDFSWIVDFNTSFKNTFKHPSNPVVYYSYMNTLNRQTVRQKNRAGQEAIQMIQTLKPDIILGVFTDANEYAVQKFRDDPKIKIIYNVKTEPSALKYDTATNTWGIKAKPPFKDVNDIVTELNPKRPVRIAHMGDQLASVRLYDRLITAYKWQDVILVDSILLDTFDEWKKALKILEQQVDYIVISKYFALAEKPGSKSMVPTKEVMKWTRANSKVPIIGLYTSVAIEGGDLAFEDSPFEQGEIMAHMAVDLLNKKVIEPKMQSNTHFIPSKGKDTRIALPDVYSSFADVLRESKQNKK